MLPVRFLAGASVCLILAAAFILGVYGPRPELTGIWTPGQGLLIMIVLKPLIFLMIGGGGFSRHPRSQPSGRAFEDCALGAARCGLRDLRCAIRSRPHDARRGGYI